MKRLTILLAVFAVLILAVAPIAAQEGDNSYPANTITVTGTGSAAGTPDIANLEIGVEVFDPEVSTAFNQANATVDAVIAALLEAGVAREDIRTVNVNIYQDNYGGPFPMMAPNESGMAQQPEPVFRVNNMLRVTIRDIAIVADVIGAAVEAGANNIFGLNFGIDDRTALESEARADAIANAEARAQELAGLIGAELGDVIMVNEGGMGGFSPFEVANLSAGFGGGGVPIEPGQLSVTSVITVTYRINR